ncbi:3268_t:CDS:2 [Acaulospora morrowiae]|uniref:3268_t:CDS:1 n=1 Tax=Acaulospora morrowiae TaxID=94023 RepID=A0A9N9AH39_9GLOM|nr:3268_t:CDS:2 [Acaulospora morrowiae]
MTGTTGRAHPINTINRNKDYGRTCKKECHVISQVLERTVSSRPSTPIQPMTAPGTTTRCNVKIRNKPVVAVLNSETAVSIMSKKLLTKLGLQILEPSNAVIITANGTQERALGKLKDIVIESMEEMMLLGMSWFKKLCTHLYFDKQKLIINYKGESIELPIHQEKEVKIEEPEEKEEDYKEDDYFDTYEEEDLDKVESYLTDNQEDLYTNP